MIVTFLLISLLIIGFLVSVVMFIIGIILGLLKKNWKVARNAVILFIFVNVFYFFSQFIYIYFLRASATNYLNENTIPIVTPVNISK